MSNFAQILGTAAEEPVFSHSIYGERFYTFEITSRRLSGRTDIIPCMIPEKILQKAVLGEERLYWGQVRTYNKITEGKNRLDVRLFIREITEEAAEPSLNHVSLIGFICKEPVYRRTPFGREITDLLLAVNRAYGKSDYIPVITWGAAAREVREYAVGDKLLLTGRLQSREYEKNLPDGEILCRTVYEVSAAEVKKAEQ